MDESAWLAERFEEHRAHLRAVAYRMLGSLTEADDAVQDTWLRLSRSGAGEVENLGGWLTTIVARVCLNMLRARNVRREESFGLQLPDPIVSPDGELQPEEAALLADAVGLALLVVLDTLAPAERVAFVLHDMFALPFEEIAPMVGRTPAAARQLASRARRRVMGADIPAPDPDLARQRDVVDAFFLAARGGDFDALVALLDPDVVLRADFGARRPAASRVIHGAAAVAGQALLGASPAAHLRPALVNGAAGVVVTVGGRPVAVMGFTVAAGKIVAIDAIADPRTRPRDRSGCPHRRVAALKVAMSEREREAVFLTLEEHMWREVGKALGVGKQAAFQSFCKLRQRVGEYDQGQAAADRGAGPVGAVTDAANAERRPGRGPCSRGQGGRRCR